MASFVDGMQNVAGELK